MRGWIASLFLLMATSAMAGGGHQLTVSAVVLTKNNCRFTTASATLALAIDPFMAGPDADRGRDAKLNILYDPTNGTIRDPR